MKFVLGVNYVNFVLNGMDLYFLLFRLIESLLFINFIWLICKLSPFQSINFILQQNPMNVNQGLKLCFLFGEHVDVPCVILDRRVTDGFDTKFWTEINFA